jgi:uncharacterized damage-inducible protein DinB
MLSGWLDYHRATILWKVEGLDDEQLRRRLVGSRTTLLGLIKHLAHVERGWFRVVFAGEQVRGDPRHDSDPDFDFAVDAGETTEDVISLYLEEIRLAREAIAGASPDTRARRAEVHYNGERIRGEELTLRWILTHMIEETARHNGHADILRELIDGRTGD